MKRRHWYAVAALVMICTPVGDLISRAFGKGFVSAGLPEPSAPCWFTPARLLMLGALVLVLTLIHHRATGRRHDL